METKTITLDLDAYEKLRAAKRGRESFSSVVRRALIPGEAKNGAEVIAFLKAKGPFFSDGELEAIEKAAESDSPPTNPWNEDSE
ncbi:MAG: antitoxin VapB family protein [Verrucomicrobia bacterium]|nr:antitoxin VapB family protein [Verrucomicrobiota bacterium]